MADIRSVTIDSNVGDKTDAAVTTVGIVASIIAYVKGCLNQLATLLTNTSTTLAGRMQPKPTTIDLNQAAATYDLFTGTTQDVSLKTFKIRMTGGALAAPFTYFSVQTNDTTPQIILSAVDGAVANLTDQNQLFWNGDILIKVGKKIQLTIAVAFGGAARVADVVAECRAVVSGGYLAP